jgi:hypothetical protein
MCTLASMAKPSANDQSPESPFRIAEAELDSPPLFRALHSPHSEVMGRPESGWNDEMERIPKGLRRPAALAKKSLVLPVNYHSRLAVISGCILLSPVPLLQHALKGFEANISCIHIFVEQFYTILRSHPSVEKLVPAQRDQSLQRSIDNRQAYARLNLVLAGFETVWTRHS